MEFILVIIDMVVYPQPQQPHDGRNHDRAVVGTHQQPVVGRNYDRAYGTPQESHDGERIHDRADETQHESHGEDREDDIDMLQQIKQLLDYYRNGYNKINQLLGSFPYNIHILLSMVRVLSFK